MTYRWIYLCSDPAKLALTLQFLPPTLDGLDEMIIAYCSHHPINPPNTGSMLASVADRYAPAHLKWRVEDFTRDYSAILPPQLARYYANDYPRRPLGIKLLFPLLVPSPHLYTDDDVLVLRDPMRLAETLGEFGSKGRYRFEGRRSHITAQLASAFDMKDVDYDPFILDGGVWFIRDAANWRERLERFAALPYVSELSMRAKEFRSFDQRFLTMFGIEHNLSLIGAKTGCKVVFPMPKTLTGDGCFRTTFLHYGANAKHLWMRLFQQWLDDGRPIPREDRR